MLNMLTDATGVTGTTTFDFTTIDFSAFGETFLAALGVTITVSLTYIAVRKGWSMIKKALKSA